MASRPSSGGSGRCDRESRLPVLTRGGVCASAPALLASSPYPWGASSKPNIAGSGTSRRGGLSDLNLHLSLGTSAHVGIITYNVQAKTPSPTNLPTSFLRKDQRSNSASGKDSCVTSCSQKWTSDAKRFLHEHRQREWLLRKAKYDCVDFSKAERAELRRYFDALAADGKHGNKITLDRLETMLISLGLASTRKEVHLMVSKIDSDGNGALDFEEYLEIFRGRSDSEIFQVFKAMMEGKLGDPNLNFQTVISSHRRKLFIDATGARRMRAVRLPSDNVPAQQSEKVLRNFALLMRTRYNEAAARGALKEEGQLADAELLPFDPSGGVPPGSLGIVWRDVTSELSLVPSRPSSAERSARALGSPPSPRDVIEAIVKGGKLKKRSHSNGGTLVIPAPALDEQKPPPSPLAVRRKKMLAQALEEE